MRRLLLAGVLTFAAGPVAAQVLARPTDPPQVSAAAESWYQLREPIQYAGELYYPAGVAIFFNGHSMVRTGHFNGVPLYADATRDPYGVVYVPIGRGQLQPYERLRRGDLAGTTGSVVPSFPVALRPEGPVVAMAAGAPTNLPLSVGAIGAFTPEVTPPVVYAAAPAAVPACACDQPAPVVAPVVAASPSPIVGVSVLTIRRPDNNDGLWLRYEGATWVSSGAAEPRTAGFIQVGDYAGFPVFRKPGGRDTIYLETRENLLAPYRRKG